MYRSTKRENLYHKYKKTEVGCYFCEPEPHVVILKTKNFYVSKNNFPYDFWDGQKIVNHLLVVSKKHFSTLETSDDSLILEYGRLVNEYSNRGFDIYMRTPNSPSRSQPHFHTHLIKTNGKKIKSLKYKTEPYLLEIE